MSTESTIAQCTCMHAWFLEIRLRKIKEKGKKTTHLIDFENIDGIKT